MDSSAIIAVEAMARRTIVHHIPSLAIDWVSRRSAAATKNYKRKEKKPQRQYAGTK